MSNRWCSTFSRIADKTSRSDKTIKFNIKTFSSFYTISNIKHSESHDFGSVFAKAKIMQTLRECILESDWWWNVLTTTDSRNNNSKNEENNGVDRIYLLKRPRTAPQQWRWSSTCWTNRRSLNLSRRARAQSTAAPCSGSSAIRLYDPFTNLRIAKEDRT